MNKRNIKYIVLIGVIVAITCFVLCNSFYDYDKSHEASDTVSKIILPHKYATNEIISIVVRKMAHLVEYAALGGAVMSFVLLLRHDLGKNCFGTALFYALLVAVFDEYIQSFSDRTSSTGDILLDFLGSCIGFSIVWLIWFIVIKLKSRKNARLSPGSFLNN